MMNQNEQPMRKIVVFMNITLDGVIQAPGRPEEDTRGNFPYGGWGASYNAMASQEAYSALPEDGGALLLGRRTYDDFYDYWPKQTGSPYREMLNQMEKYVASTTLQAPLPWINTTLLKGDAAETVARLKAQPGKNIMIMGSSVLIQALAQHNLVDQYILLIHPLVLGTGRRLFPEGAACVKLQLVSAKATPNGVVVATYRPAGS